MGGSSSISRRDLLAAAAALAASSSLPLRRPAAAARYRRWNVSDRDCPPRVLDSFKKAIRAMLALPPSDPRNWYRYTLIHTLDCPHGNWWFLPWHRAYVGWFEQICRALSGDAEFALPYWDWTQEPRVPAAMFEDVLDPNDGAFIAAAEAFKAQYEDAVAEAGYWRMARSADLSLAPSPRYRQLLDRSIGSPAALWFDIVDDPMGPMFFDRRHARGLTAAQPDLVIPDDPPERQAVLMAVSTATILDALAPRDFLSFAGSKALNHGYASGFGVLEGQPHNLVHNCVGGIYSGIGGFMQAGMSPADPLFYLHHANVDRLWDVWSRKQRAAQAPILPEGYPASPGQAVASDCDYAAWAREPFLFFVDAAGRAVPQSSAGSYAEIGLFDYDYAPGSGEEIVTATPAPDGAATASRKTLPVRLVSIRVVAGSAAGGTVVVPLALVRQQAEPRQPKLFAAVTVRLAPGHHDVDVLIDRADGTPPIFVATLLMFGHHVMHGPVVFLVPLSAAFAKLQASRPFDADPTLNIRILARPKDRGQAAMPICVGTPTEITALSIEQL